MAAVTDTLLRPQHTAPEAAGWIVDRDHASAVESAIARNRAEGDQFLALGVVRDGRALKTWSCTEDDQVFALGVVHADAARTGYTRP